MPFTPAYSVPDERQSYTMRAGPVGCLMIHGFMGSPFSTRPLAAYLQERGITVHCPLLPGHGEYPEKLYKVPMEAWIEETVEALAYLRSQCDEIFLMGHSMGAILGAYLVEKFGDFKGQIMLAPVYDLPDWRLRGFRFARYFLPYFYPLKFSKLHDLVYERVREFEPGIDLNDPTVQAKLPEITRVPTSGIDEMRKVMDMGRGLWPRLKLPVLIFQGKLDDAARPENTQKIYDLIPSKEKDLVLFEDTGHELMRTFEPAHTQVWSGVRDFIGSRSALLESPSQMDDKKQIE